MGPALNRKYPCLDDLEGKAKRRVPGAVYDYVCGGITRESCKFRNRIALEAVMLRSRHLRDPVSIDLRTTFLGQEFSAPFGIAPVGLGDLAWPGSARFLAQAAGERNILFGASTYTLTPFEDLRDAAGSALWFQLYHPADDAVTDDILRRANEAGINALFLTVDVPYRYRRDYDLRNGLTLPIRLPKHGLLDLMLHPRWSLATAWFGFPAFRNLTPYIDPGLPLNRALSAATDLLAGHVSPRMIERLREKWHGKLIIKGIICPDEARQCQALGADAIAVSNHGGRQLDAAETACEMLPAIRAAVGPEFPLMADGGVRSGLDICRLMALGADFILTGRAYYLATAALGVKGAGHMIDIFLEELECTMGPLGCDRPADLSHHLVSD